MIAFSRLYWRLDGTTRTNEKVMALKEYFAAAPSADASWAIYFLTGNRLKRLIKVRQLADWATELADIPPWLFGECYDRVGDLAETISLLLPPPQNLDPLPLTQLIEQHLEPLRDLGADDQRRQIEGLWNRFETPERFVLGKLMTGGFRVGVSKRLVIRALAEWTGIDAPTIAHRLMGDWQPTSESWETLIDPDTSATRLSTPYPFFLANPIQEDTGRLGDAGDWLVEWKWDGVRAQLIRRAGETFIWSRGEELVTDQYPEVVDAARSLPDGTVIDGELVAWNFDEQRPCEFSQLQRRIGRKRLGKKLLDEVPVVMLAFDLLECDNADCRQQPLESRLQRLQEIVSALEPGGITAGFRTLFDDQDPVLRHYIMAPPVLLASSWDELAELRNHCREHCAEGLMLKRKASTYQTGRPVGDWWKWKIEPYTIDAVMIYAQRGHGRRASLYTDYTFAVWDNDELVPFAKAYSGLTDEEIREVDAFVRRHTRERFGPVRSVTPELVFELAFENIQHSPRHKSGIAVRFPRINRWRRDKTPADADTLETLKSMI